MAIRKLPTPDRCLLVSWDKSPGSGFTVTQVAVFCESRKALIAWGAPVGPFKKETSCELIKVSDESSWRLIYPPIRDAIIRKLFGKVRSTLPEFERIRAYLRAAELSQVDLPATPIPPPSPSKPPRALRKPSGPSRGGLIDRLSADYGLPGSKLRATLRKGGLSAPYTDEDACRRVLGQTK